MPDHLCTGIILCQICADGIVELSRKRARESALDERADIESFIRMRGDDALADEIHDGAHRRPLSNPNR